MPSLPTAGHVVTQDLEVVTYDLSSVPLDEVLDFREAHGAEYRAYARDLRRFVRDLSPLSSEARQEALADRQEELADTAHALRQQSRRAWRRPLASFGLGIGGSAVTLASGNVPGAAIGGASALLGLKRQADPASAYAYLFRIQAQLSRG